MLLPEVPSSIAPVCAAWPWVKNVIVAVPVAAGSACEIAVIVTVTGLLVSAGMIDPEMECGALKAPELEIVPVVTLPPVTLFTCHVTAVLVVPVTVCVNASFPNVLNVTVEGATLTVTFWLLTFVFGRLLHVASMGTMAIDSKNSCQRRIGTPSNQLHLSS